MAIRWITFATRLAQEDNQLKEKRMVEELLPKEFQFYQEHFEKTPAEQLPKHQPWDHVIKLKED